MESFQLSTLEPKPPTVSGNQKFKLSQEIEWAVKKAYTTYQGESPAGCQFLKKSVVLVTGFCLRHCNRTLLVGQKYHFLMR